MKLSKLIDLPIDYVSHGSKIRKKVLIQNGEIPHLTNFSQAYFKPGQIAEAHIHLDMYETFFVEVGEGEMIVDGKNYYLHAGDRITIEPGESHELKNIGQKTMKVTYFGLKNK